ncbi:MAG TPA: S8 family serine peptidase, partial [Caldilineaceae bacterium]|nr:S8 family serine peptidase [Caldilineaceae bacterium]
MENSRITAGLRGFAAGLFLALVLLAVLVWLLEPPALAHAAGANRAFAALLIRSGAPQDGEEHEVEGLLISAPPGGVIGEWVVQSEQNMTHTLLVDAATRIDEGIPTVGSWVKARYIVQVDGTWLATRLRPDEYEAGEIVVRLASAALSGTLASQYGLSPVRTLLSSGHIYLFRTADDDEDVVALAEQLLADPAVIWAEPNFVGGAPEGNPYKVWHWGGLDPANYTNQFAFAQINLAAALEQASGAGVIVAVLDTGIDRNHPVFTNRLLAGWDMVADDADPQEESNGLAWGHGTHVAGIIAHLAPDSELLPVRVLDANGLGNTFTLAYAIEWAVHQGADVINLSLGAEANSHVLQTAIQYALEQGVVVVAAVGNNDSDHPFYPVAYPG